MDVEQVGEFLPGWGHVGEHALYARPTFSAVVVKQHGFFDAGELPAPARAAAEVFVHLMGQSRVRPYDIATSCSSRFADRDDPPAGGPHFEIVRHFDIAAPFWPLTTDSDQVCGYGITSDGHCIRYRRTSSSISRYAFGFIAQRAEFAPGCQEMMRRATPSNPAFVCEVLPAQSAVQIITNYLVDAAVSLTEGHGPLIIDRA